MTSLGTKVVWISLALLASASACKPPKVPDPNEPAPGETVTGTVLLANVRDIMNNLDDRAFRGEITAKQRDDLLQREISRMLRDIDPPSVPDDQAWQFGDAYRLAGKWDVAKTLYTRAVKRAKSKDRIVNDTLRLARAQAHLGEIDEALKTTRSTFEVGPKDKGPILMSVLYEIVPEAQGKGRDTDLARLLEDAIPQHKATVVDAGSEAGRAFLLARPLHVHKAWIKIAQLYQAAGKEDLARKAIMSDEADRVDRAEL